MNNSSVMRYTNWQLLKDMYSFLENRRCSFVVASLFRMTSDIVRLYPAIAFANIITFLTNYEHGMSLHPLMFYLATALIAYWSTVIFREVAKLIGYRVAEKTAIQAEFRGFQHCMQLDLMWHESKNTGNKMKQIYKGGEGVVTVLRMWITNFIEIGVNFIGITFILFTLDPHSAIGLILFIVLYYFLARSISKPGLSWVHKVNLKEEDVFGMSFEAMNNIRSVKVLGMGISMLHRIQKKYDSLFSCIHKRVFWFRTRDAILVSFGTTFEIAMIAIVSWKIVQGSVEVGYLVLFIQYFRKTWENVEELAETTVQFAVARHGVERMKNILQEKVKIDQEVGKKEFPMHWKTLRMENLQFSYGEKEVLSNINLTIQRGEKIGLVGLSGAGKSTLFKLLLKENEGYKGNVLYDDIHLKDIGKTSFLKHSSVVLQDTELFSFSLKENITLVNPEQHDNKDLVESVMKTAHIADFIPKLPNGMDTLIGEKGLKLSGGEKQRVGIARALFKQPSILFLDEATSHLDMESEEKIKDSLHQCFEKEVTAIVIAHRLSTIKEMDRIIVLDKGKILEEGSFHELHLKKGAFYDLWEKQNL